MKHVLFVCNHNAGRSQMAQALFEQLAPADLRAESAGSAPARQVWPEVVQVMREVGVDLSGRKPRKLLQLHRVLGVSGRCLMPAAPSRAPSPWRALLRRRCPARSPTGPSGR
jgi:hypothetical protein